MDNSAKSRYQQLSLVRRPFLDRARASSALTIPSLIPPEGHNYASLLPEPNQGLGARLVEHLASYFTTALLPPGRQFFRLGVTPEALLESGQSAVPADLEAQLSLTERIPHNEVARRGWRVTTPVSLQHLLVGGSVMEHMLPNNSIVSHPLDRFVVVRSPSGQMVEFLIEEPVEPAALPENLKALVGPAADATPGSSHRIVLYTWGRVEDDVWHVHQEIEEHQVPNSEGTYRLDTLPYFPLRWTAVAGEDYGRSKVESHLPDLRSFDGLSKAMRDGSAMASRNITLVRPNAASGINLIRKLSKANNGDTIVGNPEDVNMLQFTNTTGLQIVQVELETLRRELSAAFMLTSSVTRDAERVTAEEIRRMAQELDSVQGGAFSMLTHEMMQPRLTRLLFQMRASGQLPPYRDDQIDPTILTGLEAMGREADTSNVMTALRMLQGYPEDTYDYVKWPIMLKKGFSGLDLSDAVNTEDEVAALRQDRQQAQLLEQMATSAAGPAAQAMAQAATK